MGQAESNESAAVKRQAEGGAVPMYELLDLSGKINLRYIILLSYKLKLTKRDRNQNNSCNCKE